MDCASTRQIRAQAQVILLVQMAEAIQNVAFHHFAVFAEVSRPLAVVAKAIGGPKQVIAGIHIGIHRWVVIIKLRVAMWLIQCLQIATRLIITLPRLLRRHTQCLIGLIQPSLHSLHKKSESANFLSKLFDFILHLPV